MDAIITAGGIPEPGDALYPLTQGENKALLRMSGKSMLQWVLDAVAGAQTVENVVLIGLPDAVEVNYARTLHRIDDQGEMLANMRAGAAELRRMNPKAVRMLVIASDLPLITPQMVDWMSQSAACCEVDILYTMVERSVMEKRFPGSKRTYTHLKGMDVCGGDLNAASIDAVLRDNPVVNELIESRKNPLKQAGIIGVDTLLLMLAGQLSLDEAIKRVTKRLNVTGKGMVVPYAEMAMDVDKPFQFELVQADLGGQSLKNWIRKVLELDAAGSQRLRVCPKAKGWCLIPAVVAHSGDSWFWVAALGLVWLFVPGWRGQAAFMAASIVGVAALVLAVKFTIRRRRPEGEWGNIYRSTDPHSFPSGHATRAFLLLVLCWGVGPVWLALAVTIWAPIMSLSRVVMGVHYLSDIVVGVFIGSLAGLIMLQLQPFLAALFPWLLRF